MCVTWEDKKWSRTKTRIVVWKVVRKSKGVYLSLYVPSARSTQDAVRLGLGTEKVYKLGSRVTARNPGIYLFTAKVDAVFLSGDTWLGNGVKILRGYIPTGTLVRRAIFNKINARAFVPEKEVRARTERERVR